MDVPTVKINSLGLKNLIRVIFEHEPVLKEFGAIKIQLDTDCTLALKKRKNSPTGTTIQQIMRVSHDEPIYSVHKVEDVNVCAEERSPTTNEERFWSSLSNLDHKFYRSSVSILPHKTLFYQKWHRKYFAIHSVPRQSLLKLGGNEVLNQFIPCLTRAHGPGAIFPLATAPQHLSSLIYHHQGGARHWYIIPAYERESLKKIIQRQNPANCLEHHQLLVDPGVLDKYRIRYHRIVQYPNEFVVLSAGTLTQSFTEDASWNESVAFALPSWIEDGHANFRDTSCQCNAKPFLTTKTIDVSLFKSELIQKYIDKYLNAADNDNASVTESKSSIRENFTSHSTSVEIFNNGATVISPMIRFFNQIHSFSRICLYGNHLLK